MFWTSKSWAMIRLSSKYSDLFEWKSGAKEGTCCGGGTCCAFFANSSEKTPHPNLVWKPVMLKNRKSGRLAAWGELRILHVISVSCGELLRGHLLRLFRWDELLRPHFEVVIIYYRYYRKRNFNLLLQSSLVKIDMEISFNFLASERVIYFGVSEFWSYCKKS